MSRVNTSGGLRTLPPSVKVETGCTVVFLSDECIKEYAVHANAASGRKLFDVVHQSTAVHSQQHNPETIGLAAAALPGHQHAGAPRRPAPYWVTMKPEDKVAFDLQLASLRDPTWRKRGRDGDAASSSSSEDEASADDAL